MIAAIHCEPRIPWHLKRAKFFAEGFSRKGIPFSIFSDRIRIDGTIPILLGTTCWRDIEATGDFLLVDRCSFGDTEKYVQLVWNGHGRRGDHRVPEKVTGERWEAMGETLKPWREGGKHVVLCGQMETYSPHFATMQDWLRDPRVKATRWRPHPADSSESPYWEHAPDFEDAVALTLNSSIGVKCVIDGIPTITMDEGAMAWDVTGHSLDDIRTPDRTEWAHRLAWTQWSDEEISEGIPWDYLWS